MSSDGSDIDIQSALPKKIMKKIPISPTAKLLKSDLKKISTKIMINEALIELKSRKGVSLYAIKKYITEKYSVDTEKINYHIKKYIKSAVEQGTIVQLKGIGASGSFKLVVEKEKKKKKIKKVDKEKVTKKTEKIKDIDKIEKTKEKSKKTTDSKTNKKPKVKDVKPEEKIKKLKKKNDSERKPITTKTNEEKGKKVKMAKGIQTPSKKKAAMMKRKSIGTIIKPPKMKPKAKA